MLKDLVRIGTDPATGFLLFFQPGGTLPWHGLALLWQNTWLNGELQLSFLIAPVTVKEAFLGRTLLQKGALEKIIK